MRVTLYRLGVVIFMLSFIYDGLHKLVFMDHASDQLRKSLSLHGTWLPDQLFRFILANRNGVLAFLILFELVGSFCIVSGKVFKTASFEAGRIALIIFLFLETTIYFNVFSTNVTRKEDADAFGRNILSNFIILLGLFYLTEQKQPEGYREYRRTNDREVVS